MSSVVNVKVKYLRENGKHELVYLSKKRRGKLQEKLKIFS